jgi:hypothetical protein
MEFDKADTLKICSMELVFTIYIIYLTAYIKFYLWSLYQLQKFDLHLVIEGMK